MNWYPRYYGDYMKQTAHLSLAQHGAYTVLLDHYYGTEKPLENDLSAICRICRAFDETEKSAVESVCNQFFPLCEDGKRHNKRADEEIAKANVISSGRSRAGAHGAMKRWEKQKDSNCHNFANGKTKALDTTSTSTTTDTDTKNKHTDTNRFAIPTTEEVKVYCAERKNGINAEQFIDFYTGKGWMVGKNKMKDWKACIRTWESSEAKKKMPVTKGAVLNTGSDKYAW